jgi:hypothetical protein
MTLVTGTHRLGPDSASLEVRTFREGMAAKAGHDLVLEVTRWQASIEIADEPAAWRIDSRSLAVRSAHGGVKAITDADRAEIAGIIDTKVLGGLPIVFRSSAVRRTGDGLTVDGELTLAGRSAPITVELDIGSDGRASATVPVVQSRWGIKPYRALMGALKVRDEVEVLIEGDVPTADDA